MNPRLIALVLLTALISGTVLFAFYSPSNSIVQLKWSTCAYAWQSSANVQCATFTTQDGFVLPVVVIRSSIPSHHSDPIVLLPGGPGESSQTDYAAVRYWLGWLEEVQINRDFILFDARGTGRAYPNWDCEAFNTLAEQHISQEISLQQEYQQGNKVLEKCFEQYQDLLQSLSTAYELKPISIINTNSNAEDTVVLMSALGYSHWNILSISYGTRVALALAATYPNTVRKVILDSPYPPGKGLAYRRAEWTQYVIEKFLHACKKGSVCNPAIANIESIFLQILEQLRQAPVIIDITLWSSQRQSTLFLSGDRLLFLVFYALYNESIYNNLAQALVDFHGGNIQALEPFAETFVNTVLDRGFNAMVNLATECNDNPLSNPDQYASEYKLYPELNEWMLLEAQYDICRWSFFTPGLLQPDLDNIQALILILNGELDPITPEEWGRELDAKLSTSQRILIPNAGHSILSSGLCRKTLLNDFMDPSIVTIDQRTFDC